MKWRYDKNRSRLNVMNPDLELGSLRSLINRGLIPNNIEVIIYRTSEVILIIRGRNLRRWTEGRFYAMERPSCPVIRTDTRRRLALLNGIVGHENI
jgi:hypothetical protein